MKHNLIHKPFGLLLLCLLSLWSCETAVEQDNSPENLGGHEVAVALQAVVQKEIQPYIEGSGLIFSNTEARLSFKIGGIIQQVFVEEGQSVRKGQLLAKLDLTEINAQVTQAQNGVEKAERDLLRVERLYEDDAATLENVQDLRTALNLAQESYRIASFNQKYAEIRATTAGKIIKKLMNEGELIGPGQPVFYMIDNGADQWKVEIGLADKDWVKVNEGDQASIRLDAYPDKEFNGKIIRLAQGADPTNGTYKVEIQVRPGGVRFAAGLYAEATIQPKEKVTYPVIPIEALVEGHGKSGYVFVPDGTSKVKKIPVEIAMILDKELAISKGLENVSKVITSGSGYLTHYSNIKIIKDAPEQSIGTTPAGEVSLGR
ncbi:MAG: efflux RND transporter periplasmic adaptor subunit [Saprospiraceae bacterium]|nr:efflux RND transporter periplasmic adaptor subunit [Saprospiraceae bacterium]